MPEIQTPPPQAETEYRSGASLFQRFGIVVILASMVLGIGISTYSNLASTAPPSNRIRPGSDDYIVLNISLFVLVDDIDNPNPANSSRRSEDDLLEILDGINEIWSQANIKFELDTIDTLEVPADVLNSLSTFLLDPFFEQLGHTFEVPGSAHINGFYTQSLGGPNGVKPFDRAAFFVIDYPSVHDRRVSSHEIGHFLGLGHTGEDSGRLMFSGTNGMLLTEEETVVARRVAQSYLNVSLQTVGLPPHMPGS